MLFPQSAASFAAATPAPDAACRRLCLLHVDIGEHVAVSLRLQFAFVVAASVFHRPLNDVNAIAWVGHSVRAVTLELGQRPRRPRHVRRRTRTGAVFTRFAPSTLSRHLADPR